MLLGINQKISIFVINFFTLVFFLSFRRCLRLGEFFIMRMIKCRFCRRLCWKILMEFMKILKFSENFKSRSININLLGCFYDEVFVQIWHAVGKIWKSSTTGWYKSLVAGDPVITKKAFANFAIEKNLNSTVMIP